MELYETMKIKLVKIVEVPFPFLEISSNNVGGQIGHRKYDCPEQRNFTANIICRVCGNAGHMARDCPDRQKGSNWRNDDRPGLDGRPVGQIGQGDAVDREYESLMQELSGGGAVGSAGPQHRIEAGAGGYENQRPDNYGGRDEQNLKPWQRGPTGAPAPWQQRGQDNRDGGGSAPPWAGGNSRGGGDSYGYGHHHHGGSGGGYGSRSYGSGHAGSASAPWQQAAAAALSGQTPNNYQQQYGYGGYAAGYGDRMGQDAPPGMAAAAAPPPGLGALFQGYDASANGQQQPPPPPPPGDAPPPPVSKV